MLQDVLTALYSLLSVLQSKDALLVPMAMEQILSCRKKVVTESLSMDVSANLLTGGSSECGLPASKELKPKYLALTLLSLTAVYDPVLHSMKIWKPV